MKKKVFKGFTLIELLATILILGIIALITTIVVGGIIKDSKKSGVTLSVKSYIATINDNILSAKLRDESINDGTYKILANGNLCIGTYSNSQCVGEVLDLNIDRGIPTSGEVVITDRKVTKVLNASINGETISYDAVKNKEIISEAVLISNFEAIRYINSIKINFNAVNANSYTCEYGLTENYGSEGIVNAAKTECIINDLTPGTLYYYKLTVSGSGNKSDSKKGAIVTLPLKVNPTIALSPNGFSSTKTATIQYSDGDENARIIDPKYYFYTTSTGTSDIQVVACGTDFEPQTCGVLKTSTLKANTWYKLDDTDDIITITYLLNSTLIAKTNENNITVGSNQSLITTIDNSKPTIIVNNIKYGQSANIQLYDNQSGVSYFAVTSDTNIPSTTSSTTGNSLNTWYPTNEADPTARFTKEFPGLDAGVYYAWAKDELGNYESSRFVVDKANDVITIASVTKTYDKQNFVPNITTLSGLTTSNTYYSDSACTTQVQNPTNSGEYYVIATTSGNNNYKAETSACVKVAQIDKITIASSTTCEASKIYDGTRTATCTIGISNKIVGDNVDVSAGACNYNNANVGTNKTITCTSLALSGTDSSNYQFSGTSTTTKGNIYNATLAFNANGGTISGTTPRYVRKGQTGFFTGITNSTLGASPVGVKAGYTFDGWYTGDTKVIDPTVTFNGTKVAATASDTHKGIVYLDPTDLSRTCTAALSDANVNNNNTPTGINSGCMKFYIYDDEGSTYKMILDHNTSGNVAWNSDGTNATMNEVATRLYADTLGWIGNPKLITANEIAHIVGADTSLQWAQDKPWGTTIGTQAAWFYLDGSGNVYSGWQTQTANGTNKSRYAWLYDNIYGCSTYGCNIQDSNTYPYPTMNSSTDSGVYGYWTSNTVFDDATCAWRINRQGSMNCNSITINNDYGVRPVITIPKSIIDGTNPIQASVANWTDVDSKWLLTANAELTARYSVNKYKATFYSNMIMNGDFANTTGQGWASVSYATGTVDTSVKNGTMNSMRIKPTGSSWDGIATIYRPNFKNNTTYKITLKAYRDSSSSYGDVTRDFRVYAPELNSNGNVIDNHHGITINTSNLPDKTWKEFTYTFTTTASGVAFQYLRLDFNATSGDSNIWVSDVKLEEVVTRTYDYNSELGTIPTTTRTGYTSLGYYTGQNGTGTLISANTRIGAANTSYYENWSMQSYTISYNLNGGSVSSANPTSYSSESEYITLNNPTKSGYTFTGWTGSNGSTPQTTVTIPTGSTGDRNYTANWSINEHTVTCEDYFVDASKNRKVKLGSGTKTYNYGATASGADWGTTTSMSTYYSYYVYKEATSGTVPDNDNLVVYRYFWAWTDLNIFNAAGSQNGATVSFKVGNGSWADVTNESNTTQPWGTTYYLKNIRPVNSTTEEFSSVSNLTLDSTNQYYYYTPTAAGTSMNVYMKYKIFAITLDKQSGSGGTATIYEKYNTGYYTNNTATTQMTTSANGITVPTRTGYTFGGYYTSTNGGGTQYINASGYLTSSASATAFTAAGSLYAKWAISNYSISYNLNGGTVENANPTSYNINSGTITLTNPTRPGYTFVGWSGTGLSGSSNTSVTIPAGSTGNRSYTANWSLINYSISYDLKGGDATNPTSYNVTSNAFTLTNPTKTGFTFTGWTGSNGSTKQTTVTIPKGSTGNRSYTANWDKYNVTYELNRGTVTFASNQAVNTGFIIDYSKDFTLRARVNIPSNSTGRHMIFSNYYAMGTKQDFSIEFNADNKLRVWMNYDGVEWHSYTVFNNTVSKGVDIDVIFTWTAATKSYKFKTVGTNSNHEVSGTNANMTGIASYPLMMGTKDHRTNASSYTSITVKSASFTTTYTADSTLSTLPAPANNTSENYVFHGWFQYSDGTGTIASSSTVVNNDLTYYGHWTNEALWMSEPTKSKGLVTGTGTTQTTGYEAGTTFTFTCYGTSGHYPTSLQVKYNGTVTSTKTNNSSTTYTLSNTYTVTDYASSASVTATCTDNTGKTVNASGVTRPVYRKFRLYHNLNGATSLSGGGGTYLNKNQYLLGNSTAEGGGYPITLYNINRNRIGSEVATLGWNSSSTATSKIWSKGESVNIYYGSGTQTTGKVYANSSYNAERTIYAISYDTIPSPAMQNSNNGYFPATGTSCGSSCGTQPSQTQTLSSTKIRVYNTRRYALSSTTSTSPAIICAQQHAIYYRHAETGEKHRLDYTFVADGVGAGRIGTYIAGYVKGISLPLNNYSSTGWSCELMQ